MKRENHLGNRETTNQTSTKTPQVGHNNTVSPRANPPLLTSLLPNEIAEALGEPRFRGEQIFSWIHGTAGNAGTTAGGTAGNAGATARTSANTVGNAGSVGATPADTANNGEITFDQMTNLSKALRGRLKETYDTPCSSRVVAESRAKDGTIKFLLEYPDGAQVEAVLLHDGKGRHTICISSQVGCAVGCSFCNTGTMGFRRNLLAGEIVEQLIWCKQRFCERSASVGDKSFGGGSGISAPMTDGGGATSGGAAFPSGGTPTHIVFMGMGEPLANIAEVAKAITLFHHPKGHSISLRRITLSTCGLPNQLKQWVAHGPAVRLAVSLHSAVGTTREKLIPQGGRALSDIRAALRTYQRAGGKRVTFEYLHLPGVNDTPAELQALKKYCKGLSVLINVIPWNPVEGLPFKRPNPRATRKLVEQLKSMGLNATARISKGGDIDGACGQLAAKKIRR